MPIYINRFPAGFLDLVGAQNFGENPRALAEFVSPVVDIGSQYLVNAQLAQFGNTAVGANGFNPYTTNPLIVPTGEIWRVWSLNTTVVSAAGQSGRFAPGVRIGGTTGPSFPLSDPASYVASENTWTVWDFAEFWAPAGYEFGTIMAQVAGGPPTVVQGSIVFSRLRA